VNFSFDGLVGRKRYLVERWIRACEQDGPFVRLTGSRVFYEKRDREVKKICRVKSYRSAEAAPAGTTHHVSQTGCTVGALRQRKSCAEFIVKLFSWFTDWPIFALCKK
jgi:hypothetical protein